MKSRKPVELFLAVGLAATLGACGGPAKESEQAPSNTQTAPAKVTPDKSEGGKTGASKASTPTSTEKKGSEGGEGGEG